MIYEETGPYGKISRIDHPSGIVFVAEYFGADADFKETFSSHIKANRWLTVQHAAYRKSLGG